MTNKPSVDGKSGTEDEIMGGARNIAGKVKECVGKAVGNPRLESEGLSEQLAGKVQRKVGQIKKVLGN